ncbi:MAG: nucleoside triphosphate pyrophosphatase [Pseudomonadota bacterium]
MNLRTADRLILASTSPYRKRLLERLEVSFETIAPAVDETPKAGESPQTLALRLSREKALDVSAKQRDAMVIGSDQVASLDGQILRKPESEQNAIAQLSRCSNKEVQFHTGIALAKGAQVVADECVFTSVLFRDLSGDAILDYVKRDQPLDCAGSFRWEGLGIALFKRLTSDDPTALEGLPLIKLVSVLSKFNFNIFI